MIVAMVRDHGPKWSLIAGAICEASKARAARTVTGKMCRERYTNHLCPDLNKSPWSEQEEATLVEARRTLGNRWAKIAEQLNNRSVNDIKNHW